MPSKTEPLVLDTHVVLWFYEGRRISPKISRRITDAASRDDLYVAAMTPWEIAMLARAGRLRVHGNLLRWIEVALKVVAASVAPIEPAVAVDAVDLPGDWRHADPVDRIIVATARHLDAVLVTADNEILDYAAKVKAAGGAAALVSKKRGHPRRDRPLARMSATPPKALHFQWRLGGL